MKSYLFDTNVLVAMARNERIREGIFAKYNFEQNRGLISVVVQGEIESLALQWDWKSKKMGQLEWLLS